MAIKKETIEHLKSLVDIHDVITDFIELKKSGANYKGLSPFTNEKTPSFFVVPAKNIYKCFSSGKGGDAISFLMELEGLSYIEALKYLGKKYNVELEEEEVTPEEVQARNERESLFIILNFAKEYFKDLLFNNEEGQSIGLSYFKERGFSEETIKKFDLGYSLDKWDGLTTTAIEKQYSEELLVKAGLTVVKEDNSDRKPAYQTGRYDRFRGRVIFPIHNLTGKVVAFGARILKNEKNQPKYINSPETEVYHKSRVLYGLYQSRQAIRQKDECLLVEGYTDVISLHQAGVENVVASSGTALTEEQINLIGRYTKNVTVLFDGDAAGIKASMRGIDMILEQGLNVKAVTLPEGEDPDSFVKAHGAEGFEKHLEVSKKDFISFKTDLFLSEVQDDPLKKAGVIKDIVSSIAKIPDGISRSLFFKECSRRLGIEESVLIKEYNNIVYDRRKKREFKTYRQEDPVETVPKEIPKKTTDNLNIQEREIIRLLINYAAIEVDEDKKLLEYLLQEIDDVEFKTPVYRKMMEVLKEQATADTALADFFLTHEDPGIRSEAVDILTERYQLSDNWEKFEIFVPKETEILSNVIYTTVLRLKFRSIQRMIKENKEHIMNADTDDEIEKYQKVHLKLKGAERELANRLGIVISN